MAEVVTTAKSPLDRVVRPLVVLGVLGVCAAIAYQLVSVAFRLGARIGIRSALGVALPLFAASFLLAAHRDAVRWVRRLPAGVRFGAALVAGALCAASLPFFLRLLPTAIPVAELLTATCVALVAVGSDAIPGLAANAPQTRQQQPLAPFFGIAAGMLLYVTLWGLPRITP
jgi:hypothetical protein